MLDQPIHDSGEPIFLQPSCCLHKALDDLWARMPSGHTGDGRANAPAQALNLTASFKTGLTWTAAIFR